MSKYVQHISGTGKLWENIQSFTCSAQWMVKAEMEGSHHFLPKSEYRECDPPEEWVDITSGMRPSCTPGNWQTASGEDAVGTSDGYRLRKVHFNDTAYPDGPFPRGGIKWAFIVEKKS